MLQYSISFKCVLQCFILFLVCAICAIVFNKIWFVIYIFILLYFTLLYFTLLYFTLLYFTSSNNVERLPSSCSVDGSQPRSTCSPLFTLLRADVTAEPHPSRRAAWQHERGNRKVHSSRVRNLRRLDTKPPETTPQPHHGGGTQR